jgi:hypothetical protein
LKVPGCLSEHVALSTIPSVLTVAVTCMLLASCVNALPSCSAGSVLLQGLSISGCKGSAVRVSGSISTPQVVQWASLPPGLHLVNTVLTGNAAAVGGGVRASRAAVYLDSVELSGNKAEQLGGGVSIDGGLLVATKTLFKSNSAGAGGFM